MRDNKQRFKGVVYEPARFNVFVPDQRNIQVIENPISLSAFSVSGLSDTALRTTRLTSFVRCRRSCSSFAKTTTP